MEDNGGELAERVGTRCGQRDSLLRERRETLCPVEADRDQVGPVELCGVEGTSAADGCMRSLGGIEASGAQEVARIPGVSVPVCVVTSVLPVCVVSTCVYTSVAKCVLQRTHSAGEMRCVRGATSVSAPPCMNETPSASETPCVSVPECVLPSATCVKGAPQVNETTCAPETACVCEQPCGSEARCVNETPRVSSPVCVSGMVCE